MGGLSTTLSQQSMVSDTYSAGPGQVDSHGGEARKIKKIYLFYTSKEQNALGDMQLTQWMSSIPPNPKKVQVL